MSRFFAIALKTGINLWSSSPLPNPEVPKMTPRQCLSSRTKPMAARSFSVGALRGSVAKKKRRPGCSRHMDSNSRLTDLAVSAASASATKSSQGFANEMTETSILCVSMKWIFCCSDE